MLYRSISCCVLFFVSNNQTNKQTTHTYHNYSFTNNNNNNNNYHCKEMMMMTVYLCMDGDDRKRCEWSVPSYSYIQRDDNHSLFSIRIEMEKKACCWWWWTIHQYHHHSCATHASILAKQEVLVVGNNVQLWTLTLYNISLSVSLCRSVSTYHASPYTHTHTHGHSSFALFLHHPTHYW